MFAAAVVLMQVFADGRSLERKNWFHGPIVLQIRHFLETFVSFVHLLDENPGTRRQKHRVEDVSSRHQTI